MRNYKKLKISLACRVIDVITRLANEHHTTTSRIVESALVWGINHPDKLNQTRDISGKTTESEDLFVDIPIELHHSIEQVKAGLSKAQFARLCLSNWINAHSPDVRTEVRERGTRGSVKNKQVNPAIVDRFDTQKNRERQRQRVQAWLDSDKPERFLKRFGKTHYNDRYRLKTLVAAHGVVKGCQAFCNGVAVNPSEETETTDSTVRAEALEAWKYKLKVEPWKALNISETQWTEAIKSVTIGQYENISDYSDCNLKLSAQHGHALVQVEQKGGFDSYFE
ncbi:hypothetical protein IQ250_04570 [Pseudanabaenaceae cyanobacterium LEGE 13415]|nr:hypothetical protein [Pseudanabaenaceae cyanobacterium LEGE 13415]